MKVYTYSSSGVQKKKIQKKQMLKIPNISTKVHKVCKNKNSQIPNVTNTKYFNQSAQILFGVDKKNSTTQNAHCLLPSTTTTTTTTTGTHTTYYTAVYNQQ